MPLFVFLALLVLAVTAAPVQANDQGAHLEFELELFAWLPLPLKSESTIEGVELPELDVGPFDDVNLDVLPFFGRAELSGFGIGTGAELAWKWLFGAKWHPLEVFSLALGRRYALLDISRGSADDAFESHATYHGPYLGLGFHF